MEGLSNVLNSYVRCGICSGQSLNAGSYESRRGEGRNRREEHCPPEEMLLVWNDPLLFRAVLVESNDIEETLMRRKRK